MNRSTLIMVIYHQKGNIININLFQDQYYYKLSFFFWDTVILSCQTCSWETMQDITHKKSSLASRSHQSLVGLLCKNNIKL